MKVPPALTRTVYFEELEDGTAFLNNASRCVTARTDNKPARQMRHPGPAGRRESNHHSTPEV
jgi:hypothetical protein